MSESANPDTVYSLQLLNAYTSELDSLPIELSRNFADLRELDAVLSSSITSLITKIQHLTQLIQDQASSETASSSTAAERFWLLNDIAAETQRLKLGNEDKIRVSSQAADSLETHSAYMTALLQRIPDYDLSLLQRRTTYPHVAAFVPTMMSEGGRRRRGGLGSSLIDVDRSPRKDRSAGGSRVRNGTRVRAASPAESLLSVTSYPAPISQSNSRPTAQNGTTAPKPVNGGTAKRSRNQNSPPPGYDYNTFEDDNWTGPNNANNSADISLVSSTNTNQGGDGGDDGDGDDGRTYCFCNGPSYGEMIGCDGDDCEAEWFHLACVGLTACPQGSWYCDKCQSKRAKRAGRGGKRRGAGARGARSRGDD